MTLSQEEREQLFEFIKSKYVDYHDIRLLIAKDLEDNIVKQMEMDDSISFDDALNKTYGTYGVMGFSNVSEKYMKEMRKHFYKIVLRRVKSQISRLTFWIFFSLIFTANYLLLKFFEVNPFIFAGVLLIILLSGFIYLIPLHKRIKELKEKNKHYYLDEMLLSNNSILFPAIYAPLALAVNLQFITSSLAFSNILLAFATTISIASIYLIIINIYQKRLSIINTYRMEYLYEKTNYNLNLI
ncbi:hypothetical protein [Psychroflexus tropicus]|uniref:hypothetical protein n=1 Tax=Psychroflexus tropicus TaxID=197345 RepID=UPI00036699C4|nr:hypothetical protein [Psychroflexus tropicus]